MNGTFPRSNGVQCVTTPLECLLMCAFMDFYNNYATRRFLKVVRA